MLMKKSTKTKYLEKNSKYNGILSLIGAIFHKLSISSIWTLNNMGPYLISYLIKNQDRKSTSLTISYGYFIFPILNTTITAFMPLCSAIEFNLGVHRSIIIGALINMLAYTLLFFSPNIYLDFIIIFLFGIGLSISTSLSTKNAIMYFFNKRCLISELLQIITILLCALHNFIGENMINPKSEEPIQTSSFYAIEISKNAGNFCLFEVGCFGVSTLLSLLFIVPFDKKLAQNLSNELMEKTKDQDKENNAINDDENQKQDNEEFYIEDYNGEIKENVNEKKEHLINDEDNNKENDELKGRYQVQDTENKEDYEAMKADKIKQTDKVVFIPNIEFGILEKNAGGQLSMSPGNPNKISIYSKKALKSLRLWKLFTLVLCSNFGLNLILITWKQIGMSEGIPTNTLQLIGSLIFVCIGLGTPIYGFLCEKIPFKFLFTFASMITSFCGFTFPFAFGSKTAFTLLILLMHFNLGAYIGALPCHYKKIYGLKHYIEIGGIIALANTIMNPICAFFAFVVHNKCEDKEFGYKIMFISGATLNLFSLILSALESEDRFDYAS